MTEYPELTVIVNNREVEWEEIKHWKARRAAVTLQLLDSLDQELILDGDKLTDNYFYSLSDDQLIQSAKETKLSIAPDKMEEILQGEFKKSDLLSHQIIENTPENAPLKEMHVQIDVKGINPAVIGNINVDNMTGADALEQAFDLHPEHYLFNQEGSVQDMAETFGEYGSPMHCRLTMLDPATSILPTEIDPRTKKVVFGTGVLASDGLDLKQYALHQFMPNETGDGLHLDLGLFAPAGMPDAAIIGHQQHFAIEFGSLFTKVLDKVHSVN